jgi:predicted dehydrogenase
VIPSIKAGKSVFVEWPLESNIQKVQELADLVKQYKVKSIIGAQGGFSMGARQLNAVLKTGVIGKVRSSNMFCQTPWGGRRIPSHVDYFTDKDMGGNLFTICFGHIMEVVTAGIKPFPLISHLPLSKF